MFICVTYYRWLLNIAENIPVRSQWSKSDQMYLLGKIGKLRKHMIKKKQKTNLSVESESDSQKVKF